MQFNSVPPDYATVNSPLVWTLYDANAIDTTKQNYKYVVECWINGANVYTARTFPRPGSGIGIVDLSSIIRSSIVPIFAPGGGMMGQINVAGRFCTPGIVVKVREDYSGTTGAIVLTDTSRTFYNYYRDRKDNNNAIANYNQTAITDRDYKAAIDLNFTTQKYFIPLFSINSATYNITITAGGTTVNRPVTGAGVSSIMVNISPVAINADYPGLITATMDNYTVRVGNYTYTVNIVPAGFYTNYVIHFLNKWGDFESMLFNKVRVRSMDIVKKEFKQLPYRVDSGGNYSEGIGSEWNEQRTQFAVTFNEKLNIQTDWLSDMNYNWLCQLAASPMVFLEDAGYFHPVIVTTQNYAFKEYITDKLQTLQLDVEFTTDRNTQFR